MRKKSMLKCITCTILLSFITSVMNFVPLYAGSGEVNSTPEEETILFEDDCSNLADAGWTVGTNYQGVYITDSVNSCPNPNNVVFKPVEAGQYLLYGDKVGSDAGKYVQMTKNMEIGEGSWELQFKARMPQLVTPSKYNIYRGLSFEVFANNQEYKITFNDNNKVLVMTTLGGASIQKEVIMPSDDLFHMWAIAFDGKNKLSVKRDGVVLAAFDYTGFAREHADSLVVLNAPLNWQSGATEVYIDEIKMVKNIGGSVVDPNLVLDDECSNLSLAGWSVNTPKQGAYITDSANSIGNPSNIALKPVPEGQYLVYGDNTAGNYTSATKEVSIGEGPWLLEFDARFVDLISPSSNYVYRGMNLEVFAGTNKFKLAFADQNKIYAMTSSGGTSSTVINADMPTDNLFHKWSIAYDGENKVFIALDDKKLGVFEGIVQSNTVISDKIVIRTVPLNWVRGVTEVYLDNIKMVKNITPGWAKYSPYFNMCNVLPQSTSGNVNLVIGTADIDPVWYNNSDVKLSVSLYRDNNMIAGSIVPLSQQKVNISIDPNGETGRMKLKLQILNGNDKAAETIRDIEVNKSSQSISVGEAVYSVTDKEYIFTMVDRMTGPGNKDILSSGWRVSSFIYQGTDDNGKVIENLRDAGPVKMPVSLNGWFRVYVGYIAGTEGFTVFDGQNEYPVNISVDESTYEAEQELYGGKVLGEAYAFAADFKGNTLGFVPLGDDYARIAYIKLKGMSYDEIALYTKPDEGVNGKRVIYNNDGYSDFFSGKYPDENALREQVVNIFDGQDAEELDWCLGTTFALNYNSRYAGYPYEGCEKYESIMRDGDKMAVAQVRNFAELGVTPAQIVAERAHEIGLKTSISLRMNAFYNDSTHGWLNGSIYKDYLNYRVVNKDGSYRNEMSYAYPQVREYIKNILKEASSTEYVTGVNLDFCRYPYIFGYESILKDEYINKYGVDPKQESTAEGLRRWNQFKADIMTQFLRELRQELNGKTISIRIPSKGYFDYGFDLEAWIEEDLIDMLIPSDISHEEFTDISSFAAMVQGSNIKLYGGINTTLSGHDLTKEEEELIKQGVKLNVGHVKMSSQQFILRARELYRWGYNGIYIFNNWSGKDSLGLLGDKVKVDKWYGLAYPADWIQNMVTITPPVSEYLGSVRAGNETVQEFTYDRGDYTIVLPYITSAVPELSASALDPKASVEIVNADTLEGTSIITVTSSDGLKTMTYRFKFDITSSMRLCIKNNEASGNIGHSLASQLINILDQAENMRRKGLNKQAADHLEKFLFHLDIKGQQDVLEGNLKDNLRTVAQALLNEWLGK